MQFLNIFVIWIIVRFSTLSVYLYRSYRSEYILKPAYWNYFNFLVANAKTTFNLYLNIAFSVLIAFFIYFYYKVSSTFSSLYYFPPFLACFLSSFLGGAFPPFLFLSSTTYSYLLKILIASDTSFYKRGNEFYFIIYS